MIVAVLAVLAAGCGQGSPPAGGAPSPTPAVTAPVVRAVTPGLPRFTGCENGDTSIQLRSGPPGATVDLVVDGVSVLQRTDDADPDGDGDPDGDPDADPNGPSSDAGLVEIPCGSNMVVSLRVSGAQGAPASCRLEANDTGATDADVVASSAGSARCDAVSTGSTGTASGFDRGLGIAPVGRLVGCPAATIRSGQPFTPVNLDLPSDGDDPTVQEFRQFANGVVVDDDVRPVSVVQVPCAASSVSYRVRNGAFGRCRISDGAGRVLVDARVDDTDCVIAKSD